MMTVMKQTKLNGFTLVEILIVIGIIIVLAVVVFVGLPEAVARSRDATRLSDANQIIHALDEYLIREGTFPSNRDNDYGGWDCNYDISDTGGFISDLTDDGYISPVFDPYESYTSCTQGGMRYYRYNAGSYGCSSSKGPIYILQIVNLEGTSGTHSDSPGFSCSGRDWGTEAEWVAGKFQYPTQ